MTHNQLAAISFDVVGKKYKVTHLPDWLRRFLLAVIRTFTSSKFYGPIEFFMSVLAIDMIAPEYGTHTLEAYFRELNKKSE